VNLGTRPRDVMAVLTLVSHLAVTFGLPLPSLSSSKLKDGSRPFPCQNRPCGCLTADECWKGDCCCFTLEEKLAWAEANGIEPPEHVRPLVESRKGRQAKPKWKSCCAESDSGSEQSISPSAACCAHSQSTGSACCSQQSHEATSNSECPLCDRKPASNGREQKPPAAGSGSWRIIGVFAQICRGGGLAGTLQLDPVIVSDLTPIMLAKPGPGDWVAARTSGLTTSSHCPPTPPPRCS
jgi:hypothetical protein